MFSEIRRLVFIPRTLWTSAGRTRRALKFLTAASKRKADRFSSRKVVSGANARFILFANDLVWPAVVVAVGLGWVGARGYVALGVRRSRPG